MTVTLTLNSGLGADLGPNFNLTANVGSVTPSTATKSELLTGKNVTVDDLATQVTITSTGTCTNSISLTINGIPGTTTTTTAAPTTTTTTTTTAAPTTTTTTTTTAAPTTTTTTTSPTAYIAVINSSLNVPITDVTIGGTSVTYYSGTNFPINAGEVGSFSTTNIGNYSIRIYYGTHISGQHIDLTDSNSVTTCHDLNPGGGLILENIDIDTVTSVQISVADGTCV